MEEKAAAIRGQISNKMTGKRSSRGAAAAKTLVMLSDALFFAWLPLLVYFRAYQTINKKKLMLLKEQDLCLKTQM